MRVQAIEIFWKSAKYAKVENSDKSWNICWGLFRNEQSGILINVFFSLLRAVHVTIALYFNSTIFSIEIWKSQFKFYGKINKNKVSNSFTFFNFEALKLRCYIVTMIQNIHGLKNLF